MNPATIGGGFIVVLALIGMWITARARPKKSVTCEECLRAVPDIEDGWKSEEEIEEALKENHQCKIDHTSVDNALGELEGLHYIHCSIAVDEPRHGQLLFQKTRSAPPMAPIAPARRRAPEPKVRAPSLQPAAA